MSTRWILAGVGVVLLTIAVVRDPAKLWLAAVLVFIAMGGMAARIRAQRDR